MFWKKDKSKTEVVTVKKTAADRKRELEAKRKERHDNEQVTLIRFTYDEENEEYIYDERTGIPRKDLPHSAVHVTGKKKQYLWTDIWDELAWPGTGQSAIHMYLWMINEKINPDTLSEKKSKMANIDWQKILIVGIVVVCVVLIAPKFL